MTETATTGKPTIEVKALRDIAFEHWDPLDIAGLEGCVPGDRLGTYDTYLEWVGNMLIAGLGCVAAGDFLAEVEEKDLGLMATDYGRIHTTVWAVRRRLLEKGFDV